MNEYRIYLVNQTGEFLEPFSMAYLENDADALLFTERLTSAGLGAEVWNQDRLVGLVPPKTRRTESRLAAD